MAAAQVALLKITLHEVEPRVTRRIIVPTTISLDRLHLVIQAAMGWTNSHLYEIKFGEMGWGEPDPEGVYDGPLDAKKTPLIDALRDTGRKNFLYVYDLGDNWRHTVKVEKILLAIDGEPTIQLVDAVGRCPPEDSGGSPGYETLLQILADPEHEEYEEALEWSGGPINPADAGKDIRESAIDCLAKRWAPRPKAPRPG